MRMDESNYETAPGSVIVKLKPEYLKTLEVGNHTITALFDDGNSASAHFSVLAPKASEESEGKQDSTKAPTNNDNNAEGAIESTKATTNNASDANDSTTAEMLNNNAGNANDSTTAEMLNDNVGNATESTATNTEGGSNVALWLSIMIAAVIGLGIALRPRRR